MHPAVTGFRPYFWNIGAEKNIQSLSWALAAEAEISGEHWMRRAEAVTFVICSVFILQLARQGP